MELERESPGTPRRAVTMPAPALVPTRSQLRRVGPIPALTDATGYRLDERPLLMSGVQISDLHAALDGQRPLGFPSIELWQAFQQDLADTLAAAGITDASVRLGGSSRSFFSSPWARRPFPQNLGEVRAQVMAAAHNQGLGLDELERRIAEASQRYVDAGFTRDAPKPGKHFWDSRYMLHIDGQPADYDLEVASDQIDGAMRRMAAEFRATHLGAVEDFHPPTGTTQWNQDRVCELFPELAAFRQRWAAQLGRPVDFECFDGNERLRFAARTDWWVLAGLQ